MPKPASHKDDQERRATSNSVTKRLTCRDVRASVRATLASSPDDLVIFPANDKMEALTPSVRHGDDRWFDIVKWSFQALVAAEAMGITQANVDEMLKSQDPSIHRFPGVDRGNGTALGLDEWWAYNIISSSGIMAKSTSEMSAWAAHYG